MKVKLAIVALVVVIVALGVGLMVTHSNAVAEKQKDTQRINAESNKVVQTQSLLTEQVVVNTALTTNLNQRVEELKATSNSLVGTTVKLNDTTAKLSDTAAKLNDTAATLAKTAETLAKTEAAAKAAAKAASDALAKTQADAAAKLAAQEAAAKAAAQTAAELAAKNTADVLAKAEREKQAEIGKRDARITDLVQNTEKLTQQMGVLTNALNNLNTLIAKTQKELDQTKNDKDFLTTELKRLQIEKAELERQMNDLAFLRDQVRHLKEEMAIAKRTDWSRKGITSDSDKKGGQLLNDGIKAFATKTNDFGDAQLNVELRKDGSISITAPAPKKDGTVTLSTTNAPPTVPAPKAPAKKGPAPKTPAPK